MDLEEARPKKPGHFEIGSDLSELSVAELRELVEKLQGEIARIEDTIKVKESSLSAADQVFKI